MIRRASEEGERARLRTAGRVGSLRAMVRRSLWRHRLSTVVTACSVACAVGLVMAVLSLDRQAYAAFTGGSGGFDAVLGARGSQLQLVLNSVFHLETSPGNIPWSLYRAIAADPRVEVAVPYAVGDNYRGYRIVGTTSDLFARFEPRPGRRLEIGDGGRPFDPERREAVLGSVAARDTGLGLGSTFNPYHGLVYEETAQHPEVFTVVGVLEPTGTPVDRVFWVPIESVYRMTGHVLRGTGEAYEARAGEAIPDEHKEVSAVMLALRGPQAGFLLNQTINRQGKVATLAWPIARVMADLLDKLGWVQRILTLVAYLVVLIAGGSIFACVYNTINERRHEIAVLRALGAGRSRVLAVVVCEAIAIAACGAVLGFAVLAAILVPAAAVIRAQTGVVVEILAFHPAMLWAPLAMTALGALAGLAPAIRAYATDVAQNLVPRV